MLCACFGPEKCKSEKCVIRKKYLIKQILLCTGSIDDRGDYWGHDTNLGNIDELVTEILETMKL